MIQRHLLHLFACNSDPDTCPCSNYASAREFRPLIAFSLTAHDARLLSWLRPPVAYRLWAEGKDLPMLANHLVLYRKCGAHAGGSPSRPNLAE